MEDHLDKLEEDGHLGDPMLKGTYATFDCSRSMEKAWGTELRGNDQVMTLRSNNDCTLVALGHGRKNLYVRKLIAQERPGLLGIEPISDFSRCSDTLIKRVAGLAFPVPMATAVLFRFVQAFLDSKSLPMSVEAGLVPRVRRTDGLHRFGAPSREGTNSGGASSDDISVIERWGKNGPWARAPCANSASASSSSRTVPETPLRHDTDPHLDSVSDDDKPISLLQTVNITPWGSDSQANPFGHSDEPQLTARDAGRKEQDLDTWMDEQFALY